MKIIALSGPQGSGKDTAGRALADLGFYSAAFATPIKRALSAMFELPPEIWEDRVAKEVTLHDSGYMPGFHYSPRYLMQTLGTEWGRDMITPEIWVKAVEREIELRAREGTTHFVITDVRFDSEAVWTRNMGGTVVEIVRPGHDWNPSGHVSEHGPARDLIDHVIHNDGNVNDLRYMISARVDQLLEP